MLLVLSGLSLQAQSDIYTVLPNNGGTSQNGRAPQGARPAGRSVWIITADEMAASGFTAGSVVNSIGFTYTAAQNITTTGTIVVYMQNTADVTNTKSTTWATAIAGMTTVNNSAVTIPNVVGSFDIPFTGGSTFTYTGGSLYIAFDYQNFSNPIATTANTGSCNNSLAGGLLGAISAAAATTPPATVAASAFRPETRLGKAVTCARPTNLSTTNPTLTSVDATFNVTAGGSVEIEYGDFGFTQGTGTTVTNITSPYTISGLTSGTVYDYYVRKDCSVSDQSEWSGPYSFNTVFEAIDPTYTESFENFILPFVGWLAVPETSADGWFINQGLAEDGAFTTASIAPTAAAADSRMYSRGVNLIAGSDVTVDYWVRNYLSTSTNAANYELTAGTAKDVPSQVIPIASEPAFSDITYVEKTFTFTAPSTGVFYFCFHNMSPANATGVQALLMDNFVVTQVLKNNDFLASKLNVYPNPSKNIINISNDVNAVINSVEMTDMNGRVVKAQNLNAANGQISISDLATGVYMMKIKTDQGVATKKVVKE